MALVSSTLQASLLNMFTVGPTPATMVQHFKDFAQYYDDYAKLATESLGGNVLLTTGKTSFESTAAAYSALPTLTLVDYADYIEKGCIAYWTSSVFSVAIPPPGFATLTTITITPMSPGVLKAGLAAAFLSANGVAATLASNMATLMDTATKTVTLTLTGVTPAPAPLTISMVPIS